REVTETLEAHPNVTIVREEVTELPLARPLIVATGPLTSESLTESLKSITGDSLYFYDAVAPTVTLDSLDMTRVFRASRRGRGSGLETTEAIQTTGNTGTTRTAVPIPNTQYPIPNTDPSSADYLNSPITKSE